MSSRKSGRREHRREHISALDRALGDAPSTRHLDATRKNLSREGRSRDGKSRDGKSRDGRSRDGRRKEVRDATSREVRSRDGNIPRNTHERPGSSQRHDASHTRLPPSTMSHRAIQRVLASSAGEQEWASSLEDSQEDDTTVADGSKRRTRTPRENAEREEGTVSERRRRRAARHARRDARDVGEETQQRNRRRRHRAPGPGILWFIPITGILIFAGTVVIALVLPPAKNGMTLNYLAPVLGGVALIASMCVGGVMIRRKRARYFEARSAAREEAKRRIREQIVEEMLRQQREGDRTSVQGGAGNGDAASIRSFELSDVDEARSMARSAGGNANTSEAMRSAQAAVIHVEEDPISEQQDIKTEAARIGAYLDEKTYEWMQYLEEDEIEELLESRRLESLKATQEASTSIVAPQITVSEHVENKEAGRMHPTSRRGSNRTVSTTSSRNQWEASDYDPTHHV